MSPVRFTTENGCGSHRLAPYHKRRRNTTNLEILNLSDWNKHHQEQEVIHQKEGDLKIYKLRDQNIKTGKQGCQRTVFYPELEESFDSRSAGPYYITCKEFYQNVNKTGSDSLPRLVTRSPWQAIKSVVHVNNPDLSREFEEEKLRLLKQGKVDEHGLVRETLLFHGSENENINIIVEENFSVDHQPQGKREKTMLFGRGLYMSPLPGVGLMYGQTLLLCKVLLGKCQTYHPTGFDLKF